MTLTDHTVELPGMTPVIVDVIEDEDPFWLWTPERLDEFP